MKIKKIWENIYLLITSKYEMIVCSEKINDFIRCYTRNTYDSFEINKYFDWYIRYSNHIPMIFFMKGEIHAYPFNIETFFFYLHKKKSLSDFWMFNPQISEKISEYMSDTSEFEDVNFPL